MRLVVVLRATPHDSTPIIGPPSMTAYGATRGPPAARSTSATEVPTGTQIVLGSRTAPVTVSHRCVTARPSRARRMLMSVPTFCTTTPMSSGMPPSGTIRPVTSQTSACSSPAG